VGGRTTGDDLERCHRTARRSVVASSRVPVARRRDRRP
jgi:hypothetical protein